MKPLFHSLVPVCGALLASIALGGCASHEALPNYYVLTPGPSADSPAAASHRGTRIFIRRVTLPDYLQPGKIASRRVDSQIEYSSTALWAGGLREGFGHALAGALSQQPNIGAVSEPPLGIPPPRDYDLIVGVERFEGDDHGEVVLAVRWQLYLPESAVPLVSRRSRFARPGWTYGDEAGEVRLMSMVVQDLAAQIGQTARR